MAQLPNATYAWVPSDKVLGYLLARGHPEGGPKAAVFEAFGFTSDQWWVLEEALLEHARIAEVVDELDAAFGLHYIIEGPLTTPSGRRPMVRSVWIVEYGKTVPRLVTAHPGRRRNA